MLWLRWRLVSNQIRSMGSVGRFFSILAIAAALIVSISMFFVAFWVGFLVNEKMSPTVLMFVWDITVGLFCIGWGIGVLTELQQSQPLSLDKFFHLPVSPRGAFLMNYLSSYFSLTMVFFLPAMVGFATSHLFRYGWQMMLGLLLLAGFLLMVTSVTYQFRGWLASMMVNKRRQKTILTCLTIGFVLLAQTPNLLNATVFQEHRKRERQEHISYMEQTAEWRQMQSSGEMELAELDLRISKLDVSRAAKKTKSNELRISYLRMANMVVPLGWLPAGIESLATKRGWMPLGALFGMLVITGFSLSRSYRSTLRIYRGDLLKGGGKTQQTVPDVGREVSKSGLSWIAKDFPLLNEGQSAVAGAVLLNITRAIEMKLALLAPLVIMICMAVYFGMSSESWLSRQLSSFTAIGACTFAAIGVMQLTQNQFGYDRAGFRAYLLSPIPRRDILVGKNAANGLVAIVLVCICMVAIQFSMPLSLSHFIATFVSFGSIYLITSIVGNFMSILAPIAVKAGSMQPASVKWNIGLAQMLLLFLVPLFIMPVMLPIIIEWVTVHWFGWTGVPVYLILSVVIFAVTTRIYGIVMTKQGQMLNERQEKILAVIATAETAS